MQTIKMGKVLCVGNMGYMSYLTFSILREVNNYPYLTGGVVCSNLDTFK